MTKHTDQPELRLVEGGQEALARATLEAIRNSNWETADANLDKLEARANLSSVTDDASHTKHEHA